MGLICSIRSIFSGSGARTSARPLFLEHYPSFSPFDSQALADLARRLPSPCRMLEVGSWLGQGSTKILIAAGKAKDAEVFCVDTWQGNLNVEKHQQIVGRYDVLGTFLHNVNAAGGSGIVRMLVMSSESAARVLADASFDLVFIDADHSYRSTKSDIRAWRSKVTRGGILCGHDCEGRVADFGRERLANSLEKDTIAGNDRFPQIHPGVILAVDEEFGDQAELFAERTVKAADGTIGRSTIWYTAVT
jgi:predicted O-methyltransferase YrrM